MIEKRWLAVGPIAVTASGTTDGKLTLTSAKGFKVKQKIQLLDPGQPLLPLEIKRIIGPYIIEVGAPGTSISSRANVSLYGTSSNVFAPEQPRNDIPLQEIDRAVYEEEPTVAIRTYLVDQYGNPYDLTNPLAVNATVTIPSIYITAADDDPNPGDKHDSIRIGDGTNTLAVNSDGSLNVVVENSVSGSGLTIYYNEQTTVASGVETTLISLVAPLDGYRVYKIDVSGENVAVFQVKINGTTINKARTWFCNYNYSFLYEDFSEGLFVSSGQTLQITALHNRPNTGDFNVSVVTET